MPFLAPVPENDALPDQRVTWTEEFVSFKLDVTTMGVFNIQSSSKALVAALSHPRAFQCWLHEKANQKMLVEYKKALHQCYSNHAGSDLSGTLFINKHSCQVISTCAVQIKPTGSEPDCTVTLSRFRAEFSNKLAKCDSTHTIRMTQGTPSCSVKTRLGNCDIDSFSSGIMTAVAKCIISL